MPDSPPLPRAGRPIRTAPGRTGGGRWPVVAAFIALPVVIVVLGVVSLLFGSGDLAPGHAVDYLLGNGDARADAQLQTVVMQLRLPRAYAAVLVGAALGMAGALLQAVTRNPLAETGLLGVNSGAAFAVVLGITYAHAQTGPDYLLWALAGALGASAIVLVVAAAGRVAISPLRLVLAGAALMATFRGLTSYLLLSRQATYDQYREWALGQLTRATTGMTLQMLPVVVIGIVLGLLAVRPLAALALGDDAARALGHRPGATRAVVALSVALLTGAAVAIAGPLTFLGLLAPYLARALSGPRMLAQLGLSALFGAAVLLACDIAARLLIRPAEAPVSVLLALIGGPVLIWVARSHRMLSLRTPAGS